MADFDLATDVIPIHLRLGTIEYTARLLTRKAHRDGGFTFNPWSGKFEKDGYAVALATKVTATSKGEALSPSVLQAFLEDAAFELMKDRRHGLRIGGWTNHATGQVVIELSEVFLSLPAAMKVAKMRHQIAVGDLAKYARGEDGDIPVNV